MVRKILNKFLDSIEWIGNKFPHPFMIFVYLTIVLIITSFILNYLNVTFVEPETDEVAGVNNLVSPEGIEYAVSSFVTNFTEFAPLGIVLAIMLGVGLAQSVGLLDAAIKALILKAPKSILLYVLVFTGVTAGVASDAAYAIIPPLAMAILYALGKHPIVGLGVGFSSTVIGNAANWLITGSDALLAGISTEVARTIDSESFVTPVDNWFFLAASVPMIIICVVVITKKIIEPRNRFEDYDPSFGQPEFVNQKVEEVSSETVRGLKIAGISGVSYLILIGLTIVPPAGVLRGEGGSIVPSPFLDNIVPLILFFFLSMGIAYGIAVKEITNPGDVPRHMTNAMTGMASYIVLVFAIAQFVAYFDWTNIGPLIAVTGADILLALDLTGLPIIIGFIILTMIVNLVIASGSAQWTIFASVFLPMFMLLDYHPAFVQLAFRIGDSSTTGISPVFPYMVLIIAFIQRYDRRAGFGIIFSTMIPYVMIIPTVWVTMFVVWNLLGLPIGPGVYMYQ